MQRRFGMTTRVQEKGCMQRGRLTREPHMGLLEKCMLRSAVFDPADKVLDANVCSGQVAEYLLQHMDCQVCGVSDRMEEIRRTRARMYSGDFVYAAIGDIPWQDNTFDTVLLHPGESVGRTLGEQLAECKRVLKPGGQLVLGLRGLSPVLRKLGALLWESTGDEEGLTLKTARELLQSCGFGHLSVVRCTIGSAVIIAWKDTTEE